MRIAVLEDDTHMAELMRLWLEEGGYEAQVFGEGNELIRALGRESFDLLIIDWLLPDIDGDKVLVWVREHIDWPVPVLFVTQRDAESDVVTALELGADDYMTKPVSRDVLTARVKALLRRAGQYLDAKKGVLEIPPYRIDLSTHSISCEQRSIELTQKEYDLAVFLFKNLGRVVSRGHILEAVWGRTPSLNTRTVDTHVSRLRTKLGLTDNSAIRLNAIYQHGYRLERFGNEAQTSLH
ncbi:MAG: response regulator transcription factor [Pseudomonadota bacterium]